MKRAEKLISVNQSAAYFSRKYPYPKGEGEGGGGWVVISIVQVFKRKYEAKLEIPGCKRVQTKEPSLGEVWIFFGTTHYN